MDLLTSTALTQVEQALQTTILVALGKCITQATITTLRAVPSAGIKHNKLGFVTATNARYRFDRFSTASDDGVNVLKPTDNPTAGRWLLTTSTAGSGYLKTVELCEGQATAEEILARYAGTKPCVVIVFQGADNNPLSQIPGALYDYRPQFVLWCVSSNLRSEHQTATGSQITSEASDDPGTNRIVGDLKALLAGNDLGVGPGVKWTELRREEKAYTSLADKVMVYQLGIEVRASLHNPDTDLVAFTGFNVQRQIITLNGQDALDSLNYIVSGLTVNVGAGLTQTVNHGGVYVDGTLNSPGDFTHSFSPSVLTYRDFIPGSGFTFIETALGADVPPVTANAIRIGVTTTSDTDVVGDQFLTATKFDYGDIDLIPPP